MNTVEDILKVKGSDVWSITINTSVYRAIELMAEKKVGALLVVEQSKAVGIISETDYTRKVILKGRSSKTALVDEIMTTELVSTFPQQDIEECMVLMTDHRIRHLPVIDNGELLGIISIGDLVKAIIDEQRYTINQLEHYIAVG
jgi:CBS domain-containing protein